MFKSLARDLPQFQQMTLHYLGLGAQEQLRGDVLDAILDRAFLSDESLPRDRAAFEASLERGRTRLSAARAEIGQIAAEILEAYHEVRRMLGSESLPVWAEALADIRDQLAHLIYPGFLRQTPAEWLPHLPRYLRRLWCG